MINQDVTEREIVRDMARAEAERFELLDNKGKPKPSNPFALKVERFKKNAEAGNVLLEDGTWINREEAEAGNMQYKCPIEWLASKDSKGKNIGNISKILGSI